MLEHYNIAHLLEKRPRSFDQIAGSCTDCGICQKECAFLQKYGSPGTIAGTLTPNPGEWLNHAFECSLCGLCTAVCPVHLDPSGMFHDLRKKALESGKGRFNRHRLLINYEKIGISRKFTYYALPENCDTIFFPGCALPGARPATTLKTFSYLKEHIKNIGIVLDCCTKPSHDLGRIDHFNRFFSELKLYLLENGIRTILVACPSCHSVFKTYAPEFETRTVYEVMAQKGIEKMPLACEAIILHDPCATRFESSVHDAVREIAVQRGLHVVATPNEKESTFCCGEGGAAGCLAPQFERQWMSKRLDEAGQLKIASYCAGCVSRQQKKTHAFHMLDLVFDPYRTMKNKVSVSKAPFTYLNRLKLKKKLKRLPARTTRERAFFSG